MLNLDLHVALVDASGVAFGTVGNPLNAAITGAGAGGTSAVDEAAWTAATSAMNPGGGVFNDSAAALTSGQQGTLRMTPNRAQHANLRNQAGTEIGTAGSPLRTDPTGGTIQPVSGTVTANAGSGTFAIQATAAAPAAVELSDGAAFYTGAKTGQLPSALVNSRLDVNVGKEPGTISSVNSSTATLLANAVFTGTSEDVSGYSLIEVSVFADQVSAAGGLSLQFSSNGTNWDFTQAVTVSASVGAMYAVCPCAQFFRVVYTNGAVNQGAFRLQTVYRPVAAAQSQATFQDVNAALSPTNISQRVAADLMIQNAAGNTTVRPRCASDNVAGVGGGSLMAAAGLVYDSVGTKFWPIAGTSSGQQFVQAQGIQASGAAVATNPVLAGGIDGALIRYFLTDTSGRQIAVGAAAAAAAIAGNPVLMGGSDGTLARALLTDTSGRAMMVGAGAEGVAATGNPVLIGGQNNSNNQAFALRLLSASSDGLSAAANGLLTTGRNTLYNATNWDCQRNNLDAVLQASGVTTAGTVNYDVTNYNGRYLLIHYNVTLWNGGTLLVKVQFKDANGLFVDIPLATTGSITSTAGADILILVGPSNWAASASPNFSANTILPRNFRIVQTVSVASITMSGAYSLPAA